MWHRQRPFRYKVNDEVFPDESGLQWAGSWQGKRNAAYTPLARLPLTGRANYGCGINSIDARGVATLAAWGGWSGSLRMRAINHYRLDGDDPSIVASGLTVLDLGAAKQLSHMVELNFSLDNLTNRDYYETQNYFESRVTPDAAAMARIHGTPAFPLTAVAGITLRFGAK